jgi:hypothetical protein
MDQSSKRLFMKLIKGSLTGLVLIVNEGVIRGLAGHRIDHLDEGSNCRVVVHGVQAAWHALPL